QRDQGGERRCSGRLQFERVAVLEPAVAEATGDFLRTLDADHDRTVTGQPLDHHLAALWHISASILCCDGGFRRLSHPLVELARQRAGGLRDVPLTRERLQPPVEGRDAPAEINELVA